ncbi:MAG: hypothetical protein ACOCQE_04645 [Halanaerobium sp.]
MKESNFVLKILNAAAVILTIFVNFLANYLPINGLNTGEVSANYNNPFTPAGFTFSIWGLIYLLLIIFTVYQFTGSGKIKEKFSTGPYLIAASAANISWIFLWHYQYIYLSMFVILLLPLFLFPIFKRVNSFNDYSRAEYISIKLPFSIYTAWVTIASLANFMVTLVYFKQNWPDKFLALAAVTALLLGLYITIRIIDKFKDTAFSLVIIWAYFGIISAQLSLNRPEQIIIITAALSILIIIFKLISQKNIFPISK